MKKLMMSILALTLISCTKSETKTEEKSGGISDLVSGVKNYSEISKSVDEVSKNIEVLKKTTPLSNEELKAILPESLLGLKRTEISVGDTSMMTLTTAEAKYKSEDRKSIDVQIMDGAGEMGSAMVSSMMMGLGGNREKTTENRFEKTTEINGMKALVSEEKSGENVSSKIQVIAKKRYLFTMSGEGISYEDLLKAFGEINTSGL
ncbi:hypothetical protein [Kaistella jeonii]|uniref:DUF4252 domain-containing protein n=1 Tax=Kaistella jeonii TaxID=266749 RepID=A0A0C1D9P7_9FLAO|nr:hypothetical protein [Kaistella jeonii]KIA90605.1 hypothetical protein OA86_01610 [Kaistella jeonii]SFB70215.1 hypothetical protein SAMN05421876_101201 [Kaistella jeonii]VEI94800.1 Uncharacterised protein [Kaistella jeonii]